MAERVTQRASFGNLTPTARPVDTFHRPDSRGDKLDGFVQWADDRLKATEGFLKAGAGAYQTYRESKFEEVRLKARADAVKNFYDPRRLEGPDFDPSIHLETDSSYALYDEEVKRIQSGLKGIEAGKGLLKDDKDLNYIFEETQRRKKDKNYKIDDKPAYNPNITEEQVFKEFRDFEYKNLPEDADAYFLEKYNQAWGEFEDKFFERLQKQHLGEKVDTLATLVQTYIESGQLAFKLPLEGEEIKLEDDDEFFYSQMGYLLQEGIASGLKENHAQAVVIKQLLLHAESFKLETDDQKAGEITEKEEEILVKIMSALDAKDTQRHFVKSGGSIAGNTFFDEIAGPGIDKINKMLEEKDNKDDADSIRENKRDGAKVTQDIYQDIYSGKITTLAQLNTEIDKWQKLDWNLNYSLPVADILSTFNSVKRSGGVGDNDLMMKIANKIDLGQFTPDDFHNNTSILSQKTDKLGDATKLNDQERRFLFQRLFPEDRSQHEMQKPFLTMIQNKAIGETAFDKDDFKENLRIPEFRKVWEEYQLSYNMTWSKWLKDNGYTNRNRPEMQDQLKFYREVLEPESNKVVGKLKEIITNHEEKNSVIKIDLEDLQNTVPKRYRELNKNGIPERFYIDAYYFFNKDAWEHLFKDDYPPPPPNLFNNVITTSELTTYVDEVQKHILNLPKAPNASYKPELSMNAWFEKKIAEDPDFREQLRLLDEGVTGGQVKSFWKSFDLMPARRED
tara:strand:- start:743 stop:2944 length:2202 start_codon:yes stop_codon:yes gene_type:complete